MTPQEIPVHELDLMKVQNGNATVVVRVKWKNKRQAKWRATIALWLLGTFLRVVKRIGGFADVGDHMMIMTDIYAMIVPVIDLATELPGARVEGTYTYQAIYNAYGAMAKLEQLVR